MTAFDLFQRATCQAAGGDNSAAVKTLDRAIKTIDRNGVDAHMRADLVDLRDALAI